jgi:beta-mannosidase
MKFKYADYEPEQNRALDKLLADAMTARDPSRHVHLASMTNEHPWLGWYSGTWTDYGKLTTQPLITEFGAQALPDLDVLRRFIPETDLWPIEDTAWESWRYHDFQPHETFTLAKVARGTTTTELIANTQRYQAELVQFAAESYRRQKAAPVGAIFQFMFNECWPSANWGIVDYWRNPKPGFSALARAYQPVLPSIAWTPKRLTSGQPVSANIWVVNDLWQGFEDASVEWTLRREASGGAPRESAPTSAVSSANGFTRTSFNMNSSGQGLTSQSRGSQVPVSQSPVSQGSFSQGNQRSSGFSTAPRNSDARVLESVRTTVNVLPDSAVAVLKFEKSLLAGDYVLAVALLDAKGRALGWNEWRFTVEEP